MIEGCNLEKEYIVQSPSKSKITVTDKVLRIERFGMKNKVSGASGETTILLKNIQSVRIKKPNLFGEGFLTFDVPGTKDPGINRLLLLSDQHTIPFGKKEYDSMIELKRIVEDIIA